MLSQPILLLILICSTLSLDVNNDKYSILLREKLVGSLQHPMGHANAVLLCENYNNVMNLSASVVTLRGMIGFGFDRLTGVTTAPVLGETFNFCHTTPDRRYFIPDNYTVEPVYGRHMDISSTEYHSYSDFAMNGKAEVSMSASGMLPEPLPPIQVGFAMDVSISGSKEKIEKEDKSILEMKVRNDMFTMKGNTAAGLSVSFRNRLLVVAEHIKKRNYKKAQFYIELLLLDYGTEVVSEVIVGTRVDLRVYVQSSMLDVSSSRAFEIKTTTSVGSHGVTADVGTSNGRNSSKRDVTEKMQKTVEIWVQGGAKLEYLQEQNQSNFLREDNPVPIAREFVPLYLLMNNKMLESFNMSISEVEKLRHMVERTTGQYYQRNRINGCTNKDAANFDFQANYDDNTCIGIGTYCTEKSPELTCEPNITMPIKNKEFNKPTKAAYYDTLSFEDYALCVQDRHFIRKGDDIFDKACGTIPAEFRQGIIPGGMFQTCELSKTSKSYEAELALLNRTRDEPCKRFEAKNIVTKDFNCPRNSHKKTIITFSYTLPDETFQVTHQGCDPEDPENCYDLKIVITIKNEIKIASYWCQFNDTYDDIRRIYFGGSFDRNQPNNFIGQPGCPIGFTEVPFFEQTVFCITDKPIKNVLTLENIAELTRLFNESEPKNYCTGNQSKHLITVVEGDRIFACIYKKHAYHNLALPVKISGPFVDRRRVFEKPSSQLEVYYNNELNHTISMAEVGHRIHNYFKEQIDMLFQRLAPMHPVLKTSSKQK
uniref:Macrophage-expressed gene 1 protein n=1 Tax=Panagrellus redivivus TaxID=6233 RepID=A0A7E4VVT2_PANRE